MSLMVSISGVRGIVGESLTPDVVIRYASAFAEYAGGGKIVIGYDGRITGSTIADLVAASLVSFGSDVVTLGIAPTPTIQIAVEQLHAAGGISITASHNPVEWNGLKFIGPSGMFLTGEENRKLWGIVSAGAGRYADWRNIGKRTSDDSFLRQHDDMVLNLPLIDKKAIQARRFKVVVDCINSAGGLIVPQLLRSFGCTVVEMNCDVSGIFVRMPEPIPEHLADLCQRVRDEKADLGVAVDPDVDRLVLITEQGMPFGEEYTITAVVNYILLHQAKRDRPESSVVVNLSTTRAVDDVVRKYGAKLFRTPVGEINVAQKMKEVGAIVGGEGSGGVIVPAVHYGRDAIVGIGIILQQLAEWKGTASEFKASLPQYAISKSKVTVKEAAADGVLKRLASQLDTNGNTNTEDGVKISYPDSWIHLRKSNTEPIIRIIAEAPTMDRAEKLVRDVAQKIQTITA
jgi:phosphomannomutase